MSIFWISYFFKLFFTNFLQTVTYSRVRFTLYFFTGLVSAGNKDRYFNISINRITAPGNRFPQSAYCPKTGYDGWKTEIFRQYTYQKNHPEGWFNQLYDSMFELLYFSIPSSSTSKIRLEKGLMVPRSADPYARL